MTHKSLNTSSYEGTTCTTCKLYNLQINIYKIPVPPSHKSQRSNILLIKEKPTLQLFIFDT
jgi:hypothetical protein